MEEIPITRTYLESLTTAELLRMADNSGIDIPPDLDRVFIIEELLESLVEDDPAEDDLDASDAPILSVDTEPEAPAKTSSTEDIILSESVPLPKQYNITFIEVMIRDPLWAFVSWEIKAQDKEQMEAAPHFGGYFLKVSPCFEPMDPPAQGTEAEGVFMVPVKPEDSAWYLNFSPVPLNGISRGDQRQYKVELCVDRKGEELILAASDPFALPMLYELPAGAGKQEAQEPPAGPWGNPLIRLSGYENFCILRRNEKSLGVKRGSSP